MPLLRYFVVAGTGLVILLFLVSAQLPKPVNVARDANPIDKTTIRITGSKPALERVTIDTSLPTIIPPAAEPPVVAAQDLNRRDSNRDAFAEMEDTPPETAAPVAHMPAPVKKAAARKRPKRSIIVTARPAGLFDLW